MHFSPASRDLLSSQSRCTHMRWLPLHGLDRVRVVPRSRTCEDAILHMTACAHAGAAHHYELCSSSERRIGENTVAVIKWSSLDAPQVKLTKTGDGEERLSIRSFNCIR